MSSPATVLPPSPEGPGSVPERRTSPLDSLSGLPAGTSTPGIFAYTPSREARARDFSVVAVDQRGIGLSHRPADGYDTATLANECGRSPNHLRSAREDQLRPGGRRGLYLFHRGTADARQG